MFHLREKLIKLKNALGAKKGGMVHADHELIAFLEMIIDELNKPKTILDHE